MTIDEAIKHCEEVAWENDKKAMCVEEAYQTTEQQNCEQCAADHRQLAEWLKELKERRQSVKRGRWIGDDIKSCSVCGNEAYWDTDYGQQLFDYCPYCGYDMRGDENG